MTHMCYEWYERHSAMLMNAYQYSWVMFVPFCHDHECSCLLISAYEWSRVAMGPHNCPWGLMVPWHNTYECFSAFMSTQEPGLMAPTALMNANEHSWAWHHDTHTMHSAFGTIINSAHECSRGLMSAHDCPGAHLSDPEFSGSFFSDKQKC